MNAKDIINFYSILQRNLCTKLFDLYNVKDVNWMFDLPKEGIFIGTNDSWKFIRHGGGVCFTKITTSEIVDAHRNPFILPAGVDAWRLLEYFDSKHIKTLCYNDQIVSVSNERSVEELLYQFYLEKILIISDVESRIYTFP